MKLKTFRCDPSLFCPHQIIMCVRYVQLKPNKRYILDDFIVMPWTFDVIVTKNMSTKRIKMLFMKTCNENRCDLYHHIINLIYNNEAKTPGKFPSSAERQKTSWFLLNHIFEESTRDLTRNCNDIVFCCCFHDIKISFFMRRNFYDLIFH